MHCKFNNYIKIEFSNGNVAIFDEYGRVGKLALMGKTLYGENITFNYYLTNPGKPLCSVDISQSNIIGFDGHIVYLFKTHTQ